MFLLDVDNTLLDNDRFVADLGERLEQSSGVCERARYWEIHAKLRSELGYADYLASLRVFRGGLDQDPELLPGYSYACTRNACSRRCRAAFQRRTA